jgi:hypothetical protein
LYILTRDRNFEKIGIGFGKKFVKVGRPGIPDRFSTRLFLKNRESGPEPGPVSSYNGQTLLQGNIEKRRVDSSKKGLLEALSSFPCRECLTATAKRKEKIVNYFYSFSLVIKKSLTATYKSSQTLGENK